MAGRAEPDGAARAGTVAPGRGRGRRAAPRSPRPGRAGPNSAAQEGKEGRGEGKRREGAYHEGRGWRRGGGSGRRRGGEVEGNELSGEEEDVCRGVEGRERKREAVWVGRG
jgi:hypothetical protein